MPRSPRRTPADRLTVTALWLGVLVLAGCAHPAPLSPPSAASGGSAPSAPPPAVTPPAEAKSPHHAGHRPQRVVPVNASLLAYHDFETAVPVTWTLNSSAAWYTGLYALGHGALHLWNKGAATTTLSTAGYENITVQVALLGLSLEGSETVIAECQRPGDPSWSTVATLTSPADDGYYRYAQVSLPATVADGHLSLRLRLTGSASDDHGYLDEIYIYGQTIGGPRGDGGPDCPTCLADFALYDPYTEDDGVWEEETIALRQMLDTYGFTYQIVDDADLNAGVLGTGATRQFRAVLSPGGYAFIRENQVNAAGHQAITAFVHGGGDFIGFCAGSYWAADTVVWAQAASGGGGAYNSATDYLPTNYGLDLFPGTAVGPLGWVPWNAGTGMTLEKTGINLLDPTMARIGMPDSTRMFYYGGPVFRLRGTPPDSFAVWAWAAAPPGTPAAGRTGDGEATIVRFTSGAGHVTLFSFHPEIALHSTIDGVTLQRYVDENAVAWETGGQGFDEIALAGWNIVHAALQLATRTTPTPLNDLPGSSAPRSRHGNPTLPPDNRP